MAIEVDKQLFQTITAPAQGVYVDKQIFQVITTLAQGLYVDKQMMQVIVKPGIPRRRAFVVN